MKTFITALLLGLTLLGCTQTPEAETPVIKATVKAAACTLPNSFETPENVLSAVNCLEQNINTAFASIRGKENDQISVAELRKLQNEGILEFAVTDESQWNAIAGILSLVHPEGKEALSKKDMLRFLNWVRSRSTSISHFARYEKYRGKIAPFESTWVKEMTDLTEELLAFLSDKGSLTLEQAQSLISLAEGNLKEKKFNDAKSKLPAIWRLKALVLESTRADEKVTGGVLKTFLRLAIQLSRQTENSYRWWESDFSPAAITPQLAGEWGAALQIAENYFRSVRTFDLDTDEMRALVRLLLPQSEFPDRIPDLVKISHKLLQQKGDSHGGLMYGLVNLFEGADQMANTLEKAARWFPHCTTSVGCAISQRQAMTSQQLSEIALLSSQDWNSSNPGQKMPRRRDANLAWKTVLKRFSEREVIANVFRAFDHDNNNYIPYTGTGPEDLREATDVAYTIISLISSESRPDVKVSGVYLRPSTIVDAIGLIGDKWVTVGNNDGQIDVAEFYSALKVYDDINFISRYSSLSLPTFTKEPNPSSEGTTYVERASFVKSIGAVYAKELPYLVNVFSEFEKQNPESQSLMELIVPKHADPIMAYTISPTPTQVSLPDYVGRQEMAGPVAMLVLLDRLIVKCDTNEDELFNWTELNCVTPLILEASSQFFKSDLVNFPAFLPDGVKLATSQLAKTGLPLELSKTILLNGSTVKVNLTPDFMNVAKTRIHADTRDISGLLTSISRKPPAVLQKEISVAVIYSGSTMKGAWAKYASGGSANSTAVVNGVEGWDSVTDSVIRLGMMPVISENTQGLLSQKDLEKVWNELEDPKHSLLPQFTALKTLIPMAFVFGARPAHQHLIFNKVKGQYAGSLDPISPANLLSVVEGLVSAK